MKLINIEKKKTENNKQFTYRVLKENIMNLILAPGEQINEVEISEILNVSRTPVREAFIKLSEEKLIKVFPQRGSVVSKIDLNLVDEATFMREVCEREVFKIACEDKNSEDLIRELEKNVAYQTIAANFDQDLYKFFKLDNQFHMLIFEYYNKKNVWKTIKKLCTHYDRLRLLDAFEKINIEKVINQHIEMIEILKKKDQEKIQDFLSNHLYNYKKTIDIFVKQHPTFFEN